MIGGVTRLGRLPGLLGRVTLSAGVAFCHVNDSRWGIPTSRGRVQVTVNCLKRRLCIMKSDSKSHSTEMLQREQIMRGKEHWPPKCVVRPPISLFTSLVTTQQRLVTSPRAIFRPRLGGLPHLPGVPHLHVNMPLMYFSLSNLIRRERESGNLIFKRDGTPALSTRHHVQLSKAAAILLRKW